MDHFSGIELAITLHKPCFDMSENCFQAKLQFIELATTLHKPCFDMSENCFQAKLQFVI